MCNLDVKFDQFCVETRRDGRNTLYVVVGKQGSFVETLEYCGSVKFPEHKVNADNICADLVAGRKTVYQDGPFYRVR